jgi:hypothetical protein
MLSERHADLLEIWSRYALKYPASPDDFVLDFLRRRDRVAIDTIPMVFYDRAAPVPVVRGEWRNAHTVIQHPSINRWPKPARYRDAFCGSSKRDVAATTRQRKHLFFRNFGGEFARVEQWMRQGDGRLCESAWVFDAVSGRYAPELFWESHPDEYFCKPRRLEDSWRGFEQEPRGGRYRDRAIKRMKLDAADGGATWWRRWWAASTPVERNSDAGA